MEYGLTGPTAIKDIDPSGTGLSDVAAAFIAANCSPFTNPRDFPCPAKVPDPRNTQNTSTMFIWSHFDIPAVGGDQVVISSADPLAPVPIIWGGGNAIDDNNTKLNPNQLAALYETHHCSDMIYQMRELGRRSKQYRVVGHGLKVWVSKNTQVSRGSIEAGQFNYADSRNFTNSDPPTWLSSTAALPTNTTINWTNAPGLSNDVGWHGMSMQCRDIARYRAMLSAAKEQEVGFLAADEGCTIRWTDSNEFNFQTTTDRGCVFPFSYSYGNRGYQKYETVNASSLGDAASPSNSIQFYPTYYDDRGAAGIGALEGQLITIDSYKQLGTMNYFTTAIPPACTQAYYTKMSVAANSKSSLPVHQFFGQGDRENTPMAFSMLDPQFAAYCTDPHKAFDKGLFADITGLDPSQVLTVQVCWHIEYVPKGVEPWDSQPSPVDISFDVLSSMCRDRKAFPIVTKGHSFFSSLRKALSKAFSAIGTIVSSSAPAIAAGLSSVPDPRAQAAAAGVSMLGGIASAFKRPRMD